MSETYRMFKVLLQPFLTFGLTFYIHNDSNQGRTDHQKFTYR